MNIERPVGRALFLSALAAGALSALGQLNPTVNVLPRPQTPVPGECEQGLAPAPPKVIVGETPPQPAPPKQGAAPPALDLKTRLRALQTAADAGDRDTFEAALASARGAIAAYPTGGERDAASDVLRVYDDLDRLWTYSLTSASGSFFDSTTENGSLLNMLRRYPDYIRTIRDSAVNVGSELIYPSAESRVFLAGEASKRLANLGVHPPQRIAQVEPVVPSPAPRPLPSATPPPGPKRVPAVRATTPAPQPSPKTVVKPPVKVAQANPLPAKPRHSEPAAKKAPAIQHEPLKPAPVVPVAPVPQPVPRPAPQPVPMPKPQPAPITATVAPPPPSPATSTTAAPPSPSPATTATTATVPAIVTPPATATQTTATSSAKPPANTSGGKVNLLFAIILIVIGIGVLIVLLRASD